MSAIWRKAYYFVLYLIAVVILVPWIVRSTTWGPVVDSAGQSRVWWYAHLNFLFCTFTNLPSPQL